LAGYSRLKKLEAIKNVSKRDWTDKKKGKRLGLAQGKCGS